MKCRYLFAALSAFLLLIPAGLSGRGEKKQSVRTELSALQQATGLTVTSVGMGGSASVFFAGRSWRPLSDSGKSIQISGGALSPDGQLLAAQRREQSPAARSFLVVSRPDGSEPREYREIKNPFGFCWSPDLTRLVLALPVPYQPQESSLVLLDLATGVTQEIYNGHLAYAQTQCFSSDGGSLVFEAEQSLNEHHPDPRVFIYNIKTHEARELTRGGFPTWSPDGRGISFLDHKTYYLMNPQTGEKKKLFKNVSAYSALWWSPDSRFVAYNAYCCFWESLKAMADAGRLHVRRLEDGADDWVSNTSPHEDSFNWVRTTANKKQ